MSRLVPLLIAGLATGCTAIKSTVHLAQAEQAVQLAREAEAPEQAPYAWTMAEQLILKAREEWAAADYGPAETLSIKAMKIANDAAEQARTAPRPEQQPLEAMLPEATNVPDDPPDTPDLPDDPDEAWPEGTVTEGQQPWGDQ